MNPWATSTIDATTANIRLAWLWCVLHADIRHMLMCLPAPVYIPYLPTTATHDERATAAHIIERVRDFHLGRDLPGDILAMADRALTDAVLAHTATGDEDSHLTTDAQARTRAVTAYLGIGPEDVGVPDTLQELEM